MNVTPDSVLEILSFLRRPQSLPLTLLSRGDNEDSLLNELIVKCCFVLDSNAEEILKSEAILQLDQELLMEVLTRDTLVISSELIVFGSLTSWTDQQCLKQRRPLTGESKREVIGKALYAARFLTMTKDEFMRGPYSSDLLTDEEKDIFLPKICAQDRNKVDTNEKIDSMNLPTNLMGLKLDLPRTGLRKESNLIGPKRLDSKGSKARKTVSKKVLNGLSGIMICVIQLLD